MGWARLARSASWNPPGFFGLEPEDGGAGLATGGRSNAIGKTRAAFDYLKNRRDVAVEYRYPSKPPLMLAGVEGVRVYVLGPPENEGSIRRSSPTKAGKEVYEFGSPIAAADSLAAAFARLSLQPAAGVGPDCPFESEFAVAAGSALGAPSEKLSTLINAHWNAPDSEWRKTDLDWTAAAETLALNLDSHTNNTGLVLAFEFVESKRVLLFPGDAQVGNWLSWQDTKWSVKDGNDTRTVTEPNSYSAQCSTRSAITGATTPR